MNLRILVLQTVKLLLRQGSKLFYLIVVDGKKRAFEKVAICG